MKNFICSLLDEYYEILGNPPCKYAVVALGPLAREEMTPYSDFEWAILIEDVPLKKLASNKRYFRNLADLLHLKIIGLGETILPSMGIESLNPSYIYSKANWSYFDNIVPRGFAFDGLMPQACKTPRGKYNLKGDILFELIHTPKNMVDFQNIDWFKAEPQLAAILTNVSFLSGDKNLLVEYQTLLSAKLDNTCQEQDSIREYFAINLLTNNLAAYELKVDLPGYEGSLLDTKKDLYRLPHIVIESLALLYKLEKTNGSLAKIDKLVESRVISESNAFSLKWVMVECMELRLNTYHKYKAQRDDLSPLSHTFNNQPQIDSQINIQHVDSNHILEIYLILSNFHQAMTEFIGGYKKALHDLSIDDNNPLTRAKVAMRLQENNVAKAALNLALKNHPEDSLLLKYLGRIAIVERNANDAIDYFRRAYDLQKSQYVNEPFLRQFNLQLLAAAYRADNNFNLAIFFFKAALNISTKAAGVYNPATAAILGSLGECHKTLGQIEQALPYYQQALAINRFIHGNNHPYTANNLRGIAITLSHKNSQESIDLANQALAIDRKFYGPYHPSVATSLNDLGMCLSAKGEFTEACECFEQAIEIDKDHHKLKIYHNNLDRTYNNLIQCITRRGQ